VNQIVFQSTFNGMSKQITNENNAIIKQETEIDDLNGSLPKTLLAIIGISQ
jgi:hypothetical protein